MADLNKMSKADLIKLLEAQAASPQRATEPVDNSDADLIARLEQQNRELMAILAARRQAPEAVAAAKADEKVKVVNCRGVVLSFEVTDSATGRTRAIRLERPGEFATITREQYTEMQERYPHFFEAGYINAPGLSAESANTITNVEQFLSHLKIEDAPAAIQAIDSIATLNDLFNHIENMRWEDKDEKGRPHTEPGADGRPVLVMKQKHVEPKLLVVLLELQRRIYEVSGVRVTVG